MWAPLYLEHGCSEFRIHLVRFFFWAVWSVLPYLSLTLGWKLILFYIRMATPSCFLGPFVWKFFSSLIIWGSVFVIEVHFMYAENSGSCLHILSVSLCFLIGGLNSLRYFLEASVNRLISLIFFSICHW